jgi:hypothetical protein
LFLDLNLLAVALPVKSRKWRWILLAAVLIWVVSLLSRALTRQVTPDTWLEGSVTNLQPRAIYPMPGGIGIQAVANGSLQFSVR